MFCLNHFSIKLIIKNFYCSPDDPHKLLDMSYPIGATKHDELIDMSYPIGAPKRDELIDMSYPIGAPKRDELIYMSYPIGAPKRDELIDMSYPIGARNVMNLLTCRTQFVPRRCKTSVGTLFRSSGILVVELAARYLHHTQKYKITVPQQVLKHICSYK